MGFIKIFDDIKVVSTFADLRRFVSAQILDIVKTVNGNLSFNDNFKGQIITVTFPVANESIDFPHQLKYIPTGLFVMNPNNGAVIYYNAGSTKTHARLASTVTVRNLNVFIY